MLVTANDILIMNDFYFYICINVYIVICSDSNLINK